MEHSPLPKHVAIIMDGNGRWARQRGHLRFYGHVRGTKRVREIVEHARKKNIQALTLYAFSEENWGRPEEEVGTLMRLLEKYLDREADTLVKNGVRLFTIGNIDKLPSRVREKIEEVKQRTSQNSDLKLTVALSYGSRQEIVSAVRRLAAEVKAGQLAPEAITESNLESHLFTAESGAGNPDLMIRTSGEVRISNFLLWQIAYAELYFTQVPWPDFDSTEFDKALSAFAQRDRRYGKVTAS